MRRRQRDQEDIDGGGGVYALASAKSAEGMGKSKRMALRGAQVKEHGGSRWATAAVMRRPSVHFVHCGGGRVEISAEKMLAVVAEGRAARFGVEAWLALIYGRRIIGWRNRLMCRVHHCRWWRFRLRERLVDLSLGAEERRKEERAHFRKRRSFTEYTISGTR